MQAGRLDKRTANLLNLAYSDPGGGRIAEAALRILEQRINAKALVYFRDLAQRVSADPGLVLDAAAEEGLLYDALLSELGAGAQIGAQSAIITAAKTGAALSVAWDQVNERVATWAIEYTYDLVRELTNTTQAQLQAAVSSWHSTPGMTRAQLEQLIMQGPDGIPDLVSKAGRLIPATERASMIAVTETTRSYSAGGVEGMREAGVTMAEPTRQPPAHVRCRCDISPFPRDDGVMSWKWLTLKDDLVCEICEPLHGQDVGAHG